MEMILKTITVGAHHSKPQGLTTDRIVLKQPLGALSIKIVKKFAKTTFAILTESTKVSSPILSQLTVNDLFSKTMLYLSRNAKWSK